MPIRIDCYLAVQKRFEQKFPNALFENVTRKYGSVLSPTWELLNLYKTEQIDINKFFRSLLDELKENIHARQRILELREIARTKLVFLVCFEKDFNKCHRFLLKKIIEEELI